LLNDLSETVEWEWKSALIFSNKFSIDKDKKRPGRLDHQLICWKFCRIYLEIHTLISRARIEWNKVVAIEGFPVGAQIFFNRELFLCINTVGDK